MRMLLLSMSMYDLHLRFLSIESEDVCEGGGCSHEEGEDKEENPPEGTTTTFAKGLLTAGLWSLSHTNNSLSQPQILYERFCSCNNVHVRFKHLLPLSMTFSQPTFGLPAFGYTFFTWLITNAILNLCP